MTDRAGSRGSTGRFAAQLARWEQRGRALWDGAVSVVPPLDLLAELGSRFRRLNGSVLVGHVAYRLFVWLVPLLLAAVGLLGYGVAEGFDLVRYGQEAGLDGDLLQTTSEQVGRDGLQLLLVALFALLWATRGLLRALFQVYAQAWAVEPSAPRPTLRAVGLTAVGAVVTLALIGAMNALAGRGPVLLVSAGLVGAVSSALILWLVSWLLPHRACSVLELLPGALIATIGLVAISLLGGLYFPRRLSDASQTYGSMGFTLVFLFFMWLWAFLLVGGAFVNAVWCDRGEILGGRPWVAAPERLPGWMRSLALRLPGVGPADEPGVGPGADGDRNG